ncbi:hypothetical protein K2173_004820 [Erythroxylum novogranatense]|uniref:SKP1-like protein n=1 Tax=Erythroxylum novogranatense TaxID=1862640 RepID=A0AAV8SJZ4_9ROSI|nr:hypothetical protein K2173_004820 [Erythroxylum novogranatense]
MSSPFEVPEATIPTVSQTTSSCPRVISLKTADGEIFRVESTVAMEFGAVKAFYEDNETESWEDNLVVPLPNADAEPLSHVIEYCSKQVQYRQEMKSDAERDAFSSDFVKSRSNEELKEMIMVANYLNVKDLLELLNQAVADRIENKSVEYVRSFFGIQNDFTPEEEARLRQENEWAFEGVDQD